MRQFPSTFNHQTSCMINSIATSLGLILLAAILAAAVGGIAINLLPCSWFGSGFEGACGFGALLFVFAAGVVLAVVLAISFNVMYFRKRTRLP